MISSKSDKNKFEKNSYSSESEYFSPPETILKPANSSAPTAVIGPKIRFKGELIGEEDLLVQGTVEGTIELKNHNLVIGEQGTIKANATAKTIIVEGRVEGDLTGAERIIIKESSDVTGNITAERVALEDGAKFRGSIDMSSGKAAKGFDSINKSTTDTSKKD